MTTNILANDLITFLTQGAWQVGLISGEPNVNAGHRNESCNRGPTAANILSDQEPSDAVNQRRASLARVEHHVLPDPLPAQ